MTRKSPVFTLINECQDCCKCLRVCPVKAIKVAAGRATVIGSRCLACGRCVAACPNQAKKIRPDLDLVLALAAAEPRRLTASLAPSWRAAFDLEDREMVRVLKSLGFGAVSETALGAQMVSGGTVRLLGDGRPGLYISTACPVIVDYVRLYRPRLAANLIPLASPALTHAAWLRQTGGDRHVVFLGPCIAKKNEADRHPNLLAAALTFEELRLWLARERPPEGRGEAEELSFFPRPAREGALYPVDGGMNETLRLAGMSRRVQLLNISSLDLFIQALDQLNLEDVRRPLFIEAMACPGGCVSGPAIASRRSNFLMVSDILAETNLERDKAEDPEFFLAASYEPAGPGEGRAHSPEDVKSALARIGKYRPEDEVNCSGCGYHSCRELARALLAGDAEPAMCASFMRQQAARKAAAMFKSMPSGMVMLDKNLHILEANEAFVRLFAGEAPGRPRPRPEDLLGRPVEDWLDLSRLFKAVMRTGHDLHKEHHVYRKRLYDLHVFCIDRGETIGALITDITVAWGGREKIAQKAREVITRNITIVQEIAGLLGEHMVETETILSSIAADFTADGDEEASGAAAEEIEAPEEREEETQAEED